MHLGDWIGAGSDLVVAITAVVTAVLAYREYLRPPQQESSDVEAPHDEFDVEAPLEAARLTEAVVFDTSKQTTTLRVTQRGLECHLANKASGNARHQWTIGATEAATTLRQGEIRVDPGARANSGRFSIGRRRNWLYSKKLFPDPDYLRGTLNELLRQTTGGASE